MNEKMAFIIPNMTTENDLLTLASVVLALHTTVQLGSTSASSSSICPLVSQSQCSRQSREGVQGMRREKF